jgi:hypothetical protein
MTTRQDVPALAGILALVGQAKRALSAVESATDATGVSHRQYQALERAMKAVTGIEVETRELLAQAHGLAGMPRSNPPLVVFGNPPLQLRHREVGGLTSAGPGIVGQIAEEVHQLKYQHVDDGKPYVHDFEAGVEMWALIRRGQKNILLTHAHGAPLWEDFE